ncbi:hypothetical protein [Streptosporangium sp. NPDC000396]|uniref:hypothetical protein n=1 Tax=Streptosporangium sp. NPDC000396 TaxID=3366185 RepID=UPI0036AFE959
MDGKVLDLILFGAWAVIFLLVSLFVPGLANLVVFWVGFAAFLWYDDLVRHDHDRLRPRWAGGGRRA